MAAKSAAKRRTGIQPSMIKFGGGIEAVRALPRAKGKRPAVKAKKNFHIRIYRDAPHGWLNDTMPGRYRKESAKDAWSLMMAFLKKSFSGG